MGHRSIRMDNKKTFYLSMVMMVFVMKFVDKITSCQFGS